MYVYVYLCGFLCLVCFGVSTWDPVAPELRIARTPMAPELRIARIPMALELRIARIPMALELRIAQGKVCFYMDSMCFYLIWLNNSPKSHILAQQITPKSYFC